MLGPAMLPNGSFVQIAPYQHVVVVMSIVLGLSVTQLLRGIDAALSFVEPRPDPLDQGDSHANPPGPRRRHHDRRDHPRAVSIRSGYGRAAPDSSARTGAPGAWSRNASQGVRYPGFRCLQQPEVGPAAREPRRRYRGDVARRA